VVGGRTIGAELVENLRTLRAFYAEHFDRDQRQKMVKGLSDAITAGLGVEIGLRVIIQPVIRLGSVRYQVLNELLSMKETLNGMPPDVVLALTRAVLV
jgi:hypothetical protein